jgi:phage terminase large subunit-like protein
LEQVSASIEEYKFDIDKFLNSLSLVELKAYENKVFYDWDLWARPEQLEPKSHPYIWFLHTGKFWGKSRTGAETAIKWAYDYPGSDIAVIGMDFRTTKRTCFEKNLLKYINPDDVKSYNGSDLIITLTNGSSFIGASSVAFDNLRGNNFSFAWCDELGYWEHPEDTWDNLNEALRIGENPRMIITTTPNKDQGAFFRKILAEPDIVVTYGTIFDNPALSPKVRDRYLRMYGGTRRGEQELYGKLLEDNPDAKFQAEWFEKDVKLPVHEDGTLDVDRIVIGADPAVTSGEKSDDTGIVIVAKRDDEFFVLADRTCHKSPEGWASDIVEIFNFYKADVVVGETNNGGDLVGSVLKQAPGGKYLPFKKVFASRGSDIRADPVSLLAEQRKIKFTGRFLELENDLCTFSGEKRKRRGQGHYDRMDAFIWAMTELMDAGDPIWGFVVDPDG